MLKMRSIGLSEARRALQAGTGAAEARGVLMAFAIADRHGDLIACERMDGAPRRVLRHAMRKAFTAAEMGRDTATFADNLRDRGGDLDQWGDAKLTTLTGGVVLMLEGEVIGAVACGGAPTDVDAEIAAAMAAAALA